MRLSAYIVGALLAAAATACLADDTAAVARLSLPLQSRVSHEQVLSDIKHALELDAENCENHAAKDLLEVPNCLPSAWRVHPFRDPQSSVGPDRSILAYGRARLQAASSTDMGPPRGPITFQTMTIEVDTSSGAEATIVVTVRGSERSDNDWGLKDVLRKLDVLAQRVRASKPKGDKD